MQVIVTCGEGLKHSKDLLPNGYYSSTLLHDQSPYTTHMWLTAPPLFLVIGSSELNTFKAISYHFGELSIGQSTENVLSDDEHSLV